MILFFYVWHFCSWLMRGILFADLAHASHLYLLSKRPLGSLPHSWKNTLLVQIREILWATKQQVEVSTPATISSAIPPCSEDRSAPYQRRPHVDWYWWRLRRQVTRKRQLAQWHRLSSHLPRSLSSTLQQSGPPLWWFRPPQASALLHLSLCLGYILSRDILHRLNSWLFKVLIWVIAPA